MKQPLKLCIYISAIIDNFFVVYFYTLKVRCGNIQS